MQVCLFFFDNTFPHTVTLFWQQTTDNQQFHFSHADDDQRLRHTHRDTINHFTTVQSRLYVDSGTDYKSPQVQCAIVLNEEVELQKTEVLERHQGTKTDQKTTALSSPSL